MDKDSRRFSDWASWVDRTRLDDLGYPGVNALALSSADLPGQPFSWQQEIVYLGMTNAKGGLKSRLQQFDNIVKGGEGHGADAGSDASTQTTPS